MNATLGASRARRVACTLGEIALATLLLVARCVRIALFGVLATLEPLVRWVLSSASLGLFLTCGLYALIAPPGVKFPYAIMLWMATAAAAVLTLYELLLRALRP